MEYNTGDPDYVHKDHNPNPGSEEAIEAGCICPVLDNEHGRGYMGDPNAFVYTKGCPVHSFIEATTTKIGYMPPMTLGGPEK